MNTTTKPAPTMLATAPAWIESAPRSGPTVRSSRIVIGAGSAPARSSRARSLADWTVKLPEMMPLPPRIGSRITGALITLLSRTMANGLPTFSRVASPKRLAPAASNRQLTENTVRSFPLYRRLLGPGLVDAAADDLDRLIHRLAPPRVRRHRAEPHRPRPVAGDLDRQVRVDLTQRLAGILDTSGLADR